VKHHGVCDLPIDQIAALAGVCRSTVQNTLHKARDEDHHHIKVTARPRPGRKNLPNLIEIVSPEWRTWIRRGPTAHRPIGSKTPKMVSPTKNTDVSSCSVRAAARSQGVFDEGRGRGSPQKATREAAATPLSRSPRMSVGPSPARVCE
jgi:hypothetical protein